MIVRRIGFRRLPMSAVRVAFREPYQVFRWFSGSDLQADNATLRRDYPRVRCGR